MEHCQEFHFGHFKIWWWQSKISRNIMKCHLKPYRGLETDREASINLLFQELRGGIRIVWEDIHRVFCKITHICSAFQRKTWTLWSSLGKMKTFFGKTIQLLQGFQFKSRFFVEIKQQQLYTSAYCKALDAFWTIMSWALELCLSRWSLFYFNDYRYSVFGSVSIDGTGTSQLRNLTRLVLEKSALFNQAPLFLRWGNTYPIHGEPVSQPFPSPHLSDEGSGPFFVMAVHIGIPYVSRDFQKTPPNPFVSY